MIISPSTRVAVIRNWEFIAEKEAVWEEIYHRHRHYSHATAWCSIGEPGTFADTHRT
jgi:hypothetical protein